MVKTMQKYCKGYQNQRFHKLPQQRRKLWKIIKNKSKNHDKTMSKINTKQWSENVYKNAAKRSNMATPRAPQIHQQLQKWTSESGCKNIGRTWKQIFSNRSGGEQAGRDQNHQET